MYRICVFMAMVLMLIIVSLSSHSAVIAIVDYADEWNKQACLGPLLNDLKQKYDDVTSKVEKGELSLDGYKMLMIGSFTTNNPTLHNSLDKSAAKIEAFLANGGVVVELTQADQNQASIDWLPKPLGATRTDLDYAQIIILEKNHAIFNKPNKLGEAELSGWGIKSGGWSTAWETFNNAHSSMTVLAANNAQATNPCILEGKYKNGRVLLLSIALDKKHVLGTTPASIENSMKMMENIIAEYMPLSVENKGKITTTWGEIKKAR